MKEKEEEKKDRKNIKKEDQRRKSKCNHSNTQFTP